MGARYGSAIGLTCLVLSGCGSQGSAGWRDDLSILVYGFSISPKHSGKIISPLVADDKLVGCYNYNTVPVPFEGPRAIAEEQLFISPRPQNLDAEKRWDARVVECLNKKGTCVTLVPCGDGTAEEITYTATGPQKVVWKIRTVSKGSWSKDDCDVLYDAPAQTCIYPVGNARIGRIKTR